MINQSFSHSHFGCHSRAMVSDVKHLLPGDIGFSRSSQGAFRYFRSISVTEIFLSISLLLWFFSFSIDNIYLHITATGYIHLFDSVKMLHKSGMEEVLNLLTVSELRAISSTLKKVCIC